MNMRLLFLLSVAIMSGMLTFSASSQQRPARVALIIGNASYPDASTPLSSTLRDARALAEEFRRTEFDVDLKENAGKEEMRAAIDAFTGKIRNGMTALFYFNGFGIQVARQTYLIPVNAQIWTENDVRRDGISIDAVLAEMHRKGAKVKIVILDAARRNPFERRFRSTAAGLAAIDAPEGTLAMFSAAPGKVHQRRHRRPQPVRQRTDQGDAGSEPHRRGGVQPRPHRRLARVQQRAGAMGRLVAGRRVLFRRPADVDHHAGAAPAAARHHAAPAPNPPHAKAPAPTQADAGDRPGPSARTAARNRKRPKPVSTKPGDTFRDCDDCVEMVVVPAGTFPMGSSARIRESDPHGEDREAVCDRQARGDVR